MKTRTYDKVPLEQLNDFPFRAHLMDQMKNKYAELQAKIAEALQCKIEDLTFVHIGYTSKQHVFRDDKKVGEIDFTFGYDGTDLIDNQITARWDFTADPKFHEYQASNTSKKY